LIVDETFVDWVEEESVKQLAVRDANVVVLRSLTKFFALPGLRVGCAVASPRVIQRLQSRIEPWSVNIVAQEVGKACLQDRRFIERSRAFMNKERTWLSAQLSAIQGLRVFPSSANFLLLQTRTTEISAPDIAERLAREKLLIRVCDNFVGLGKQFFRAAVRTRTENLRLVDALRTAFI
jgi:threonine-phosphate decarboxylase